MSIEQVYGIPGVRAARTATHRSVLAQGEFTYLKQGVLISGANSRDPLNTGNVDVLLGGLLMGRITSGGLWAPSILGVTSNAEAAGSTAVEVSVATATELNRRVGASGTFKLAGPPSAAGVVTTETVTYSAINLATGAITVTALVNAFIAGSFVQPTDGSEMPRSLIPDTFGYKVTDQDGVSVTNVPWDLVPIAGCIDASQIRNWPSDTSLRAFITTRLNDAAGGQFVFDHIYGQ